MIGSSAQGKLVVAEKVVREGTTRTREKTRKEEEGRARWLQIEPLRPTESRGEDLESRESVYPCMYTWLLQSCSLVQG